MKDKRSHFGIEVAERFADGLSSPQELAEARSTANAACTYTGVGKPSPEEYAAFAVGDAAFPVAYKAADAVSSLAVDATATDRKSELKKEQVWHLRCIFGNPFRPVAVDPAWLRWNGGTVTHLAQAAYEERHLPSGELDRGKLAILADALEGSSCTNADLLDHLRGPGPHVRGCWVVDLLLGKS